MGGVAAPARRTVCTVGVEVTTVADDRLDPELEALLAAGEAQGCLNLAQVSETLAELGVDDEDVAALWERARERGLEINDDWN